MSDGNRLATFEFFNDNIFKRLFQIPSTFSPFSQTSSEGAAVFTVRTLGAQFPLTLSQRPEDPHGQLESKLTR